MVAARPPSLAARLISLPTLLLPPLIPSSCPSTTRRTHRLISSPSPSLVADLTLHSPTDFCRIFLRGAEHKPTREELGRKNADTVHTTYVPCPTRPSSAARCKPTSSSASPPSAARHSFPTPDPLDLLQANVANLAARVVGASRHRGFAHVKTP
ncbi:hypothetical protein C8R44DRAFT_809327 [Mycena epipterygia]|nr:hypothetical protein C8R44DRAFT_809327 [Mycena epipterygia]